MENEYPQLKLENQLCFPLYAASKEIVRRYTPYLEPLGLTYTQYIILLVLWERKSATVAELGRLLWLDSGTLTPVLKKLETKELVTRSRSKQDERCVIIELTEKGAALRDEAANVPAQIGSCIRLPAADAVKLYSLLYELLDGLREVQCDE